MTEIPDSLKERARRIIEMNDDSSVLLEMSIAEALHEAAQEATARERERCVKLCERIAEDDREEAKNQAAKEQYMTANHWNAHADGCDEVAAAIRQGA